MNNLVSIQDFKTPYLVSLELENNFEEFIAGAQKEILIDLLSINLYNKFEEGLDATPPIDERWEKLLNGTTYKISYVTYRWKGMKELLVPAIYAKYYREIVYQFNGITASQAKSENSELINPAHKIVNAYNKFSEIAGYGFLSGEQGFFSTLEENTLFGYLYWSGSTYLADIAPDYSSIESYMYNNYEVPQPINTWNI
jgi:hypothetical protein